MGTFTACLTFDVDGISGQIGTARSSNPTTLSRGEFEVVGSPRVLSLLRRKGIRATFFVPGHTALAFPDLVKQMRDEGHEIGHHGWVHECPPDDDPVAERALLERGLDALDRVAGVRPIGYRAPNCDVSRHTLGILKARGFEYDSSYLAGDFLPYYARVGDAWGAAEPYRFGQVIDLVEISLNTALNDFSHFEPYAGIISGDMAPRRLEQMWGDDFDFARAECPDGHFMLTLHPLCIGRGSRIQMLERVIDRMRSSAEVSFDTLGSYQRRWRERNPLEAWKRANPLRTGANAITSL